MMLWAAWQQDWLLEHKATFDGPTKTIFIHPEVTAIDVQVDLYSDWVEWLALRDNSKYLPAMRFTGGDPTVNGQSSGLIFFVTNGWRVYFDHSVTFTGSLFSDNFPSPFIVPQGTYLGQSIVANLVTQAAASELPTVPTAAEVAAEVWSTTPPSNVPPTVEAVANAVWDLIDAIGPSLTPRESMRLMAAILGGRVSGAGTGTERFRNPANTKDAVVVTVDGAGNRTDVVTDLT